MSERRHLLIYYSAAFVNTIGVLVFTRGLTNQTLIEVDPNHFSRFGLIMIMTWGVCYYACAQAARKHHAISLTFALEKLIYVLTWISFISGPVNWSQLYDRDLFAGVFYAIYGVIDAIYMSLFLYCAMQTQRARIGGVTEEQ